MHELQDMPGIVSPISGSDKNAWAGVLCLGEGTGEDRGRGCESR